MQKSGLMAVMVAALIGATATAVASESEVVNGVTILRGRTPTEQVGVGGAGSGSSIPPGNAYYRADQSGASNALHTGSANAGGQFNNIPPGAGR